MPGSSEQKPCRCTDTISSDLWKSPEKATHHKRTVKTKAVTYDFHQRLVEVEIYPEEKGAWGLNGSPVSLHLYFWPRDLAHVVSDAADDAAARDDLGFFWHADEAAALAAAEARRERKRKRLQEVEKLLKELEEDK
jgi:hypothetical protein